MKSRRDLMLEEMGLTPVWKLRRTAPAEEAAATSETPTTGTETRITNHESRITDPGDRRSEIASLDWARLKARVASCTDCPLHAKRNKTVFGVGDENADWLFVGEGPGAEEDAQGEPFVGQAGVYLYDDGTVAYEEERILRLLREGEQELRELRPQETLALANTADTRTLTLVALAAVLVAAPLFLTVAQVVERRSSVRLGFMIAGSVLVAIGSAAPLEKEMEMEWCYGSREGDEARRQFAVQRR